MRTRADFPWARGLMRRGGREAGKTLLLSEIFPPRIGGSGSWLWEIYTRLARADYAVLAGDHERAAAFDAAGDLDIVRMDLGSRSWSLMDVAGLRYYARMLLGVRRRARRDPVAGLQCARVMPEGVAGYLAYRLLRIPYACYVHGEDITLAHESRESRLVVQRVLGNARLLICNSANSARLLERDWRVRPERVSVMHPGVDTERFAPGEDAGDGGGDGGGEDAEASRARFGWTGRKVVLTVSRLERRKGHAKMIEAMALVKEAVPDALYAIVGDGDQGEALRHQVESLGLGHWVRLLEPATDEELPRYYRACDLFILPNRTVGTSIEGFGIVLLEAQASARAVIAGDSGGTAETMEVGGTGLIVDATDPHAIAEAVIGLLRDDATRREMGARARRLMLERFAWQRLAGEARALFERDACRGDGSKGG